MSTSFAFAPDPVQLSHAVFENAEGLREHRRLILKIGLVVSFVLLAGLFAVSLALDWHFQQVWRYETAAFSAPAWERPSCSRGTAMRRRSSS